MTRSLAAGHSPPSGAHVGLFHHQIVPGRLARAGVFLARRLAAIACVLSLAFLPLAASAQSAARSAAEVKALLSRSEALEVRNPQQSLALAERAVAAAERARLAPLAREAQARVCVQMAQIDAAAAVPLAEDGILASEKARDRTGVARFLDCKGYALELMGKRSEAVVVHERAVAAAERASDKATLADTLASRGESHYYHGRYDDAIADLNRAYTLNVDLGRKNGQQYVLNAMANVYSDENVGEFDKAITYYRQILRQSEKEGLNSEVATTLFNIAAAHEKKGELDAALPEYRRALAIDTSLGNAMGIAEGERSIGNLLVKQGKPAEALLLVQSALNRFEAAGDSDSAARARIARGKAFHALGRIREALTDYEFAERHFQAHSNPRYLAKVYEAMAELRAGNGEWRKAYDALRAYRGAQEELERRAREEQSSRLRVQFDTAKKEQEYRELLIENAHRGEALRNAERVRSLQRLVILLGAAFLALLAAMALQQVHKGRRLRALAMTDELTGLPNRRSILEFLERSLLAARESARSLSVISFDIDHFKQINDSRGHHGGDRVLQAVADLVTMQLPPGAKVGRTGGEEFLVVAPGTGLARGEEIAERLRHAIASATFEGFAEGQHVTISLGVGESGGGDVEQLLKRADAALYRAKREGRNRTVIA